MVIRPRITTSLSVFHFFFFFLFSQRTFAMALPVQLPRPLRPAAALPQRARALSSPAPGRAIAGGAGRRTKTLLAPLQVRRRRQCSKMIASALSPSDPDAPPPYELDDYTAEANAAYWETRPVAVLKRGLVIGTRERERELESLSRFENRKTAPPFCFSLLHLSSTSSLTHHKKKKKKTGIEFARWFATRGSSSTEAAAAAPPPAVVRPPPVSPEAVPTWEELEAAALASADLGGYAVRPGGVPGSYRVETLDVSPTDASEPPKPSLAPVLLFS